MDKKLYREHLCTVIFAVLTAENEIIQDNPNIADNLKDNRISIEEYIGYIADEMIAHQPDSFFSDDD